jgi:carbamoyltransferase
VALNCVGHGRILREGPFENLWIQPAAGDAGGALGAALSVWHQYLEQPRHAGTRGPDRDTMKGSYLGPSFEGHQIAEFLDSQSAAYHRLQILDAGWWRGFELRGQWEDSQGRYLRRLMDSAGGW